MIRVRFHARGGHGVKTASRILGTAAFLEGLDAQDSPVYGAERRGAAVVAFTRIEDGPVRERGAITRPDLIVIGDETLLDDPAAGVLAGQASASAVFLNSAAPETQAERVSIVPPLHGLDLTARVRERLGRASALSAGLAAAAARLSGVISVRCLLDAVRKELAETHLDDDKIAANVALAEEVFAALPAAELAAVDMTGEELARAVAGAPTSAAESPSPMNAVPWQALPRSAPSIFTPGNAEARHTGSWRVERPEIDLERCTACGLCFVRCPDGAIELDEAGYPIIDYDHCKGCMICLESCPLHAVDSRREVRAW